MSDLVERLRAVANEVASELEIRTAAVIVTDGGQALACSPSVASAYERLRDELARKDKLLDDAEEVIRRQKEDRERLRAEVAALREDAERYRWLRGDVPSDSSRWSRWRIEHWSAKATWSDLRLGDLDAAIDAARKA